MLTYMPTEKRRDSKDTSNDKNTINNRDFSDSKDTSNIRNACNSETQATTRTKAHLQWQRCKKQQLQKKMTGR
jgi:hypothetical protein